VGTHQRAHFAAAGQEGRRGALLLMHQAIPSVEIIAFSIKQ
jgi:hypothetical protein